MKDDYIKRLKVENEQLRKDKADLLAIVRAYELCVTPKHCPNQDEIRKETAKEILQTVIEESGISILDQTYLLPVRVFNGLKRKYDVEAKE